MNPNKYLFYINNAIYAGAIGWIKYKKINKNGTENHKIKKNKN